MIEQAHATVSAAIERIKDPTSYTWLTYTWVVVWSVLGGMVNWYKRIKSGEARPFNLVELFGEITTSAFAGITTFWMCEWGNIDPLLSAIFIGVAGHMGTRFVFFAEKLLEKFFSEKLGVKDDVGR